MNLIGLTRDELTAELARHGREAVPRQATLALDVFSGRALFRSDEHIVEGICGNGWQSATAWSDLRFRDQAGGSTDGDPQMAAAL